MKDQGINSGLVQEFDTAKKEAKSFFGFRKMFWNYLTKLNVPFFDSCCPTAAGNSSQPVRMTEGLEYHDASTGNWTPVPSTSPVQPDFFALQDSPGGIIGNPYAGGNVFFFANSPLGGGNTYNSAIMDLSSFNTTFAGISGVIKVTAISAGTATFGYTYKDPDGTTVSYTIATTSVIGTFPVTHTFYLDHTVNPHITMSCTSSGNVTFEFNGVAFIYA